MHDPKNKGKCLDGCSRGGRAASSQRWISLVDGFISNASNVDKRNRRLGADGSARVLLSDLDAATLLGLGAGRWKQKGSKVEAEYQTGDVK